MKLESIIPEIRQIRRSLTQIITETADDDSPLQTESKNDIIKEVGNIRSHLVRIEAINQ